jgi:hypothetical protein
VSKELLGEAKAAVTTVAYKFAARVLLAVPFLLALGFATAALTLMLVERFGPTSAYLSVVGLFGGLGLLANALFRMRMPTAVSSFRLTVPGRVMATTSALLNVLLAVGIGVGLTLHKVNNPPTGFSHQGSIAAAPGKRVQESAQMGCLPCVLEKSIVNGEDVSTEHR